MTTLNGDVIRDLIRKAIDMRSFSYVPYSHFAVGAALLAEDGQIFTGCNIENAIPRLSVFAEEVAMYRAVADGKREFDAIAVIGDTEEPFVPNGAVCQLLAEFNVQEIIMTNMDGVVKTAKLTDLMPYARAPMDNALRPIEED